jgi:hypothetical protein
MILDPKKGGLWGQRQVLIEYKNIELDCEQQDYGPCKYGFQIRGVKILQMNVAVNPLHCKATYKKLTS